MTATESSIERPSPERRPLLPELTPEAELALLARVLFHEGYDDHLAGHITIRQPDDTLLVNPFELTWDELRPADIMTIDLDGNVLDGPWTVTPAIPLHLELHRARHDIGVAVHNHSRWGTIWADLHRIPPVYDQTSAAVDDSLVLFDEYDGDVANQANAAAAVAALGDAKMALLANHGVFVVGRDVRQAYHRCATLEWRCRAAWMVEAVGGGVAMPRDVAERHGKLVDKYGMPNQFEAMARRELRRDPTLLEDQ